MDDIVTAYEELQEAESLYWKEYKETWKIANHPNHIRKRKAEDAFFEAVSDSPYYDVFSEFGGRYCGGSE